MPGASRTLVRTAVLLLLASTALAARQTPQSPADVATLLAWTRQALGGDAALAAVTSFTVKGSRTEWIGRSESVSESIEIACALPDRFVQRMQHTSNLGPFGTSSASTRKGFNGAEPIDEHVSDDPLPAPVVAGRSGGSPADRAAEHARLLRLGRRAFVERVFPLFAASFSGAPLTITALGRANGPTGPAYAIRLDAADGFTLTVFVDAGTHLVAGLVWQDKPIVFTQFTMTTTVREKAGSPGSTTMSAGPPPVLPPPPTSLPDVTWQMTVGDYRPDTGLNWPHRFVTSFGGQKYEDLKLGAFKINPPIDPSTFRVSR